MTYRIAGLPPADFLPLFALSDSELASHRAMRVTASQHPGYPCRVTLRDAPAGEELILLHHVSHDVATAYRSAFAIYVSRSDDAPEYRDAIPPVMQGRSLGLRGFDAAGMLRDARLAPPGEADAGIRDLFGDPEIAYIHAHNAAHGCFVARVDRA
jgi:hypothetical protein